MPRALSEVSMADVGIPKVKLILGPMETIYYRPRANVLETYWVRARMLPLGLGPTVLSSACWFSSFGTQRFLFVRAWA